MIIELGTECEDRDPHMNQGRSDEQVEANAIIAMWTGGAFVVCVVVAILWNVGEWLFAHTAGM